MKILEKKPYCLFLWHACLFIKLLQNDILCPLLFHFCECRYYQEKWDAPKFNSNGKQYQNEVTVTFILPVGKIIR